VDGLRQGLKPAARHTKQAAKGEKPGARSANLNLIGNMHLAGALKINPSPYRFLGFQRFRSAYEIRENTASIMGG